MEQQTPLGKAIAMCGRSRIARACGVTPNAVRKWEDAHRMPRTEWTGETAYARAIQTLTGGAVTAEQLLERWPAPPSPAPAAADPQPAPAGATASS
jgi:hypothetical protein